MPLGRFEPAPDWTLSSSCQSDLGFDCRESEGRACSAAVGLLSARFGSSLVLKQLRRDGGELVAARPIELADATFADRTFHPRSRLPWLKLEMRGNVAFPTRFSQVASNHWPEQREGVNVRLWVWLRHLEVG